MGHPVNRIIEFATVGDELWIKGLYGYFSDSWIKGKIDGDKVTIDTNQYLGIYTTEMYYYFFQAADTEEGVSDWENRKSTTFPAGCDPYQRRRQIYCRQGYANDLRYEDRQSRYALRLSAS